MARLNLRDYHWTGWFGALVTRDVPDAVLVRGVPARIIRDVPEDEFVDNQ